MQRKAVDCTCWQAQGSYAPLPAARAGRPHNVQAAKQLEMRHIPLASQAFPQDTSWQRPLCSLLSSLLMLQVILQMSMYSLSSAASAVSIANLADRF